MVVRFRAVPGKLITDVQQFEHPHPVRAELNAGAHLGKGRRLLEEQVVDTESISELYQRILDLGSTVEPALPS